MLHPCRPMLKINFVFEFGIKDLEQAVILLTGAVS